MFEEEQVKQHKLSESNGGCHVVTTISYLKRVEIVSPVNLQKSFFEAVVDTHRVRDEWASYIPWYLNQIKYQLLASQLEQEGWRIDWGEEGKEEGSGARRRK